MGNIRYGFGGSFGSTLRVGPPRNRDLRFDLTLAASGVPTWVMGLDGVEIVMAVEDAFDIQIEDSEAEKILTPRQLIDLVMAKVPIVSADVCLTHRAFNLLRTFLLGKCGLARSSVTPRAQLGELLPAKRRPAVFGHLAAELVIPAPALVRADWLKGVLITAGLLSGVVAFACAGPNGLTWLPALLAMALTGYLGAVATRGLQTEFPKELRTVADLARWIVRHKRDLVAPGTPAWTREQVAGRVRQIVIDALRCEAAYREDARFIEELELN
jgi:hypothetical protein